MEPAEQAIYDFFVSESKKIMDKVKADAAAIGKDYQAIIGPVEVEVQKAEAWISKAARAVYQWFMTWTQFLDSPQGSNGTSKFSHKRLLSVAFGVVAIRQLIIGDYWGATLSGIGSIVLAIISAVTKT